jgi:hypothetical protein
MKSALTQPDGERLDDRLETAHPTGGEDVEDRKRDSGSLPGDDVSVRPVAPRWASTGLQRSLLLNQPIGPAE